jgi:dUTPase
MKTLFIKKLHPDAIVPCKKRNDDEGYDIFALEDTLLFDNRVTKVPTGIAAWACDVVDTFAKGSREEIYYNNYWIQIEGRSGLASKGISPVGGIVDKGYTGEISVLLANLSGDHFKVEKGDKIAQLIIRDSHNCYVSEVQELPETDRGSRGFGSSGMKK